MNELREMWSDCITLFMLANPFAFNVLFPTGCHQLRGHIISQAAANMPNNHWFHVDTSKKAATAFVFQFNSSSLPIHQDCFESEFVSVSERVVGYQFNRLIIHNKSPSQFIVRQEHCQLRAQSFNTREHQTSQTFGIAATSHRIWPFQFEQFAFC